MTSAVAPTEAERAAGVELVARALVEDFGGGEAGTDLTAAALVGVDMSATLVARQDGVVCGLDTACWAFARVAALHGADVSVEPVAADGDAVTAGAALMRLSGAAGSILAAERTALNIVQRLSGTATLTRAFVDLVAGTDARILDTRKTMPGMRALQRWAVRCGGGDNHRFGLFDEAMLKDNHIAACGGVAPACARVREAHPGARLHVEADTVDQVREAVDAGADVVLLDNMTLAQLRESVAICGDRALTEASGGVSLATVREIALTGVDRISIGALTHSAPAFDCALDAG